MRANSVLMSAEDHFGVIDMNSPDREFVHPFLLGNLAYAMAECQNWEFLWDFRQSKGRIYEDVRDAFEEAEIALNHRIVLAGEDNMETVQELAKATDSRVIPMRQKNLPQHSFDLKAFEDFVLEKIDYSAFYEPLESFGDDMEALRQLGFNQTEDECDDLRGSVFDEIKSIEADREWIRMYDAELKGKANHLQRFLSNIAQNSLLTEVTLFAEDNRVMVVPYHSHSLHSVKYGRRENLVLLQPGRISESYWRTFKDDICQLERLLSNPIVKEHQIEQLLRRNPLFLRGLNYTQAHFQVVLPREGASDLRPDVIVKPASSDWWDIVDLKLPSVPIEGGKANRASLSAALHEVAAQLITYQSYFDNRSVAKRVEEKYGFKCYKPKVVAIVGRNPMDLSEEQRLFMRTAYPNLDVVTYDALIRGAKELLLL